MESTRKPEQEYGSPQMRIVIPVKMAASLSMAMKIYCKSLQLPYMELSNTKITTNIVFFGLGTLAFFWATFWRHQPKIENEQTSKCLTEMREMKEIIRKGNLTLQTCRKSLWLVFNFTMQKLTQHNIAMKKKRNEIIEMEKYLEGLMIGMEEGKATVVRAKVQAYYRLGITDATFMEFQPQIPSLKQQFKKEYLEQNKEKQLSFGQIQHLLDIQIQFFHHHGAQLAAQIVTATACWPHDKKEHLRFVIPLVVIDKALKDYPHIDQTQFQSAKRKYREELNEELEKLSEASQGFTNIIRGHLKL